jgi:hypothetical protein
MVCFKNEKNTVLILRGLKRSASLLYPWTWRAFVEIVNGLYVVNERNGGGDAVFTVRSVVTMWAGRSLQILG